MAYAGGVLRLIDQRVLPSETVWIEAKDLETVACAIETMAVRGAPAIGCAAAFALAIDARETARSKKSWADYANRFEVGIQRLRKTRPTAVNLFYALDQMRDLSTTLHATEPMDSVAKRVESLAERLFQDDLATCRAIGKHGAEHAVKQGRRKLRILTHCNTGSLATAGYGTALGVVRALHERGMVEIVYADETRPWLQGSRLTAFELVQEKIPAKLIADGAAAYVMQKGLVDWVIVGADRIAANGDTANKIGTYGLAVQCKHHGVEFYVAAPRTTFDVKILGGSEIHIEERPPEEVRMAGGKLMAPPEIDVYNPSFDVTPSSLISGIFTEGGTLTAPFSDSIKSFAGHLGR